MANTKFNGTFQFKEEDRMKPYRDAQRNDGLARPMPHFFDQYALNLIVKGELEFKVGEIEGKLSIDNTEVFTESNYKTSLRSQAIVKINNRGVEKMIKEMIIDAIKKVRKDKDNKITEAEYDRLIANVNKYSIEMNLKTRDLK
jgi:peptide subunit release factor RF-3